MPGYFRSLWRTTLPWRSVGVLGALAVALAVAATGRATAAQTPPGSQGPGVYVVCSGTTNKDVAYYSAPFYGVEADRRLWVRAFLAYLQQKYHYTGYVTCFSGDSTPDEGENELKIQIATNGTSKEHVRTGWVFPTQGSPPPAPAAASAQNPCDVTTTHDLRPQPGCNAPRSSFVVCSASDASTGYVSATFAVTTARDIWSAPFRQFLQQRYGYQGGVFCSNIDAADAQNYLPHRVAALRSDGKMVVATNWGLPGAAILPVVIPAAPEPATLAAPPPGARAAVPRHPQATRSTGAGPVVRAEKPAHYVACWGEVPRSRIAYFSVPFAIQGSIEESRTDFRGYLTKNYGRVGTFNCRAVASVAAAQQQLRTWKDAAGTKDKLVDTGWKLP
jgi:hypothetical protein